MLNRILLGLVLVLYGVVLPAQETEGEPNEDDRDLQYVTDQLRLSLYAQASDRSQSIKLLQSGDLLEIEQISGPYAFVATPDGTRGWVKRGFLVDKPTSLLLLREEQQKTKALEAEIERLSNSGVIIDQYEKDMDAMVEKLAAIELKNKQAAETILLLQREIEEKQQAPEHGNENMAPVFGELWHTAVKFWQVLTPVLFAIILLSFLISKIIVETRIKNKFHGIKIW